MRHRSRMICLFAPALLMASGSFSADTAPGTDNPPQPMATQGACFTKNVGQWDSRVLFRTEMTGAAVWITTDGLVYQFIRESPRQATDGRSTESHDPRPTQLETMVVNARFVGADAVWSAEGHEKVEIVRNYFIGDDPAKWRTGVPSYRSVTLHNLYEGIDVRFTAENGTLAYEFDLATGADPSRIRLVWEGAEVLTEDGTGLTRLKTMWGELSTRTVTEENRDGHQSIRVLIGDSDAVGSTSLAPNRRDVDVAVAPIYSTYLGGNGFERGYDVALDAAGNAYITGFTSSTNFPTVDPYQTDQTGDDIFVSRIDNPSGTVSYSTYIGGANPDGAWAIAWRSDYAYITGYTKSPDYPKMNQIHNDPDGTIEDAIVTQINTTTGLLGYSTYLGGSDIEYGLDIAVDGLDRACVTGYTVSSDFPTSTPYQTAQGGEDIFVARLTAAGSALTYSTYLGGTSDERGWGIAIDASNRAFVTGFTFSTDYPTVSPYQGSNNGAFDVIVSRLSASGNVLQYSTYVGGTGTDWGFDIALDTAGNIYTAGYTTSTNFPTLNPIMTDQTGYDGFVTKLNSAGSSLVFSTYLGGDANDEIRAIALDLPNSVFVTGYTEATDFPTLDAFQSDQLSRDAFVSKLSPAGTSLSFSTYLGGNGEDLGYGIAIGGSGNCFVTGYTTSTDFPTVNAYQTNQPSDDAFVIKLSQTDSDSDGIADGADNCPNNSNSSQEDADGDGRGDVCDPCRYNDSPHCYNAMWEASSGDFPDQICPPWSLTNTASPEVPVYLGDTLAMATDVNTEFMIYEIGAAEIDVTVPTLTLEANLRLASQFSGDPDYSGCNLGISRGGGTRHSLFIDIDSVWVWTATGVKGAGAAVDADGAYHVYRLEVDVTDSLTVYIDDVFQFRTGAWLNAPNASAPFAYFGDNIDNARANTRWLWIKYNFAREELAGDPDADGTIGCDDNCRNTYNPSQADADFDGTGDACDAEFTLQPPADTANVFFLQQADFDQDNYGDVVFCGNTQPGLFVAWGKSDGTLEEPQSYLNITRAAVAVGHINGDTLLDIAARTTSKLYTLLYAGSRTFDVDSLSVTSMAAYRSPDGSYPAISAGYFNGDPFLDVAMTPAWIYYGDGLGGFGSPTTLPMTINAVSTTDFDGDGDDDLAATAGDSLKLLLNNGTGTMTQGFSLAINQRPFDFAGVSAGSDLNGDGLNDVVVNTGRLTVFTDTSVVTTLFGNGAAGFLDTNRLKLPGSVLNISVSDVDNDNDLDISGINAGTRQLQVQLNDGSGLLTDTITKSLGAGDSAVYALAPSDLNRDGALDFVVGGAAGSDIILAVNQIPAAPVLPDEMVATAYDNLLLTVTNPAGLTISGPLRTVAGSAFWRLDANNNGALDCRSYDYNLLLGEYRFMIKPGTGFNPSDPVTTGIRVNGSMQLTPWDDYKGGIKYKTRMDVPATDSMVFYYTIETTPSVLPRNAEATSSLTPTFDWTNLVSLANGTRYQFQLDRYYDFRNPIVSDTTLTTRQRTTVTPMPEDSVFYWRVRSFDGVSWSAYSHTFATLITGCCQGITGNLDSDSGDLTDPSDLQVIVDYIFFNVPLISGCAEENDLTGDAVTDPSDLQFLVDYIFFNLADPPPCP